MLHRIDQRITEEYLTGVSLPVRTRFRAAMRAWRSAQPNPVDDRSYVNQFASMARAPSHPLEVLRALDGQDNITSGHT
jgi:hypothetical protein